MPSSRPIGTLSGGERRRLQLLLTLVPQPNVLLLDEPTNDLDLDTLRALEDFLDDWPGIVVTVSHDRAFLDRVTDELLALDGHGGVRWIRGGVGAWLAQRAANSAATPSPGPSPSNLVAPKSLKPSRQRQSCRNGVPRRCAVSSARPSAISVRPSPAATSWLPRSARPTPTATLASLGEQLAAAQSGVATAEEAWLALAAEAESLGLTPDPLCMGNGFGSLSSSTQAASMGDSGKTQ